ncbi:hypothetical protein, variant 8 [Aphanomyces invadans]|uniref:Calcineurin-like phosphoesterase domain-containing protein n=1 Tax=Aphanomyces invadans TaxID=157072 RepID=A0A024THT0_9STRA|nr:hypothetical protein, variant 8 [Aphanomyces invadans]XP_008877915.1 hypothetical protein, variant 6 [Aphanomyces invadans]XP_008877916.1 hypothetical protein, variant 7 [Aphanomyces invadans]ETV93544.1 hypothetical protein, variant 6 [Aphanomyces invadans]ETV93545.1 hypothetical protein, variant 7 [Aphanomyces invadans]ETV93546.1 hypothetical protein, variant 8 [Aphanomyces invadans]|eukprot:XP_008877892.1 hypothetical protein, variant 8 [Aphanomyces invadans]
MVPRLCDGVSVVLHLYEPVCGKPRAVGSLDAVRVLFDGIVHVAVVCCGGARPADEARHDGLRRQATGAISSNVRFLPPLLTSCRSQVSLFLPIFFSSIAILGTFQTVLYLLKRCGLVSQLSSLSWNRLVSTILRNSAAVSVSCCILIVHCDADEEDANFPKTYNRHACEHVFGVASSRIPVPASYQGALFIWITGLTLAMINFVFERLVGFQVFSMQWHHDADDEDDDDENAKHATLPPEHALPMVPWYSMFMFDTGFQLLISLKIFLGRFDKRTMQAALHPNYKDYLFDHLAEKDDVWFDFMADCGDGFNSSFQIARMLAQPHLKVTVPLTNATFPRHDSVTLPRGNCLVIGGDLAYPHPDADSYESRFWRPFEYAMKPPTWYDPAVISTKKPTLPRSCQSLKEYAGPTCFAIPGNHDWFDGLNTYSRFVCERDWLGGWHLPQNTSFFALQLPHGWWVFGCDLALEDDINVEQFACFEAIVEAHIGPTDRVIIVTHEPSWILDAYEHRRSEEKLQYLITTILAGRVVVRLAGDVHNYTRHSLMEYDQPQEAHPTGTASANAKPRSTPSLSVKTSASNENLTSMSPFSPVAKHFPHMNNVKHPSPVMDSSNPMPSIATETKPAPEAPAHLIVSGGGGAFLHPTHVPSGDNLVASQRLYTRASCYPSEKVCRRYALLNILGFRRRNWRFDIVGGLGYFFLAFSKFPRCSVGQIYESAEWTTVAWNFVADLWAVHYEVFTTSYLSLATYVGLGIGHWLFADSTSPTKRLVISVATSLCHSMAAFSVLIAFESMFQAASDGGALGGDDGVDALYKYYQIHVPNMVQLRSYDYFSLIPLYSTCVKYILTIFDVPQAVAVYRTDICQAGFDSLTRSEVLAYYCSVFLYFWVAATPLSGVIVGVYLYLAVNVFHSHYNEAFSALRVASYKNFLRLHIKSNGDLEIFALGVDKMPTKWIRYTCRWSV